MPGKGHRAASRQAELRRRKRRGKARPEDFEAGPVRPKESTAEGEPAVEPEVEPASGITGPAPVSARQSRQQAAAEPIPVSRHLGGELKRIGVITVLVVVILVVLTFVLGG